MKKLSIIIPVYNSEKTIAACLESIINQLSDKVEIVIVDDGSTDKSAEIVKKYQADNECIRLYKTKNNGPSAARNYGIKKSNGERILFMDSDDEMSNDAIKTILEFDPAVFVMIGYVEKYKRIGIKHIPVEENNLTKEKAIDYLFTNKCIRGFSVNKVYSGNIIRKNGLCFDEKISYREDLDFNIRYIEATEQPITVKSYALYNYKIRRNSQSRNNEIKNIASNQKRSKYERDGFKGRVGFRAIIKNKFKKLFALYVFLKEHMLGIYE